MIRSRVLVLTALLISLGCAGTEPLDTGVRVEDPLRIELAGELYARSSADVGPPALGRKVREFRLSSLIEEGKIEIAPHDDVHDVTPEG